jgi:hypothetical protein
VLALEPKSFLLPTLMARAVRRKKNPSSGLTLFGNRKWLTGQFGWAIRYEVNVYSNATSPTLCGT